MAGMSRRFEASIQAAADLSRIVPGGAHTYAKGPDQYPLDSAPIIARGRGSHVWDIDWNEYVEYGSGLRSVILGHAHPVVVEAVTRAAGEGTNFARPAMLELEAARDFLAAVPTMEMVKFAKNGSDVTTAAVRLARAATGRVLVAVCRSQPFFSTDDWFIGSTSMPGGIPVDHRACTVGFDYNDLDSLREVLDTHPGQVACVILEAASSAAEPTTLTGASSSSVATRLSRMMGLSSTMKVFTDGMGIAAASADGRQPVCQIAAARGVGGGADAAVGPVLQEGSARITVSCAR